MIFSTDNRISGLTTETTLCPLGDIQWNGDPEEIWLAGLGKHIAYCVSQPNPWFIGMGDYIDFMSPSNRAAVQAARLYKGPRDGIERHATKLVDEVAKILEPTTGRWLGMLSGHHLFEYKTGSNTDIKLCEILKAPYLALPMGGAAIRLMFTDGSCKTRGSNSHGPNSHTVWIWAHHGCGSGMFASSLLNKLEHASSALENMDILLMGHQTKRPSVPIPKMRPVAHPNGGGKFIHRDVHLVGTGGWSKGYMEGTLKNLVAPTYVEERLLRPVSLGAPVIHIRPYWDRKGPTRTRGAAVWYPGIKVEN